MPRKLEVTRPRAATAKTTPNATLTITMPPASDSRPAQSGLEIYERIRRRAYELYEERGRQDGFEQEDWVRAEREMLRLQSRSA